MTGHNNEQRATELQKRIDDLQERIDEVTRMLHEVVERFSKMTDEELEQFFAKLAAK